MSEEIYNNYDSNPKSPSPEQNGSYTNMAMVIQENHFKLSGKSRSAENVALVDATGSTPAVVLQGASKTPSPRTLSSSDLNLKLHETTI